VADLYLVGGVPQLKHIDYPRWLLLAHDVLDRKEQYLELLEQRDDYDIILDNGAFEGALIHWNKLGKLAAELAERVSNFRVVLPDKIIDPVSTYYLIKAALRDGSPLGAKHLMAVLHLPVNTVFEEPEKFSDKLMYIAKTVALLKEFGIEWVALPRWIADRGYSRFKCLLEPIWYLDSFKVHMLGFSKNFADDILAARDLAVYGIDTAVPIWYGMGGYGTPNDLLVRKVRKRLHRPDDYLRNEAQVVHRLHLIKHNIEVFEEWVKP